jgi:hypothetical protein
MLARLIALTVAFAALAVSVPGPGAPTEDAAAYCVDIGGECVNPCMEAAAAYNDVREAAGDQDKTPDPVCMA